VKDPNFIGVTRCSHKEESGSKQILVTFRTTEKDFGLTLMLRLPREDAERFAVDSFYDVFVLPHRPERTP
jgi:hypothetical protein